MNTNSIVKQAEEKGRKLLASFFDQRNIAYKNTTDQMDAVDMIITDKNGKKAVVEIKCRNEKYEKYPTLFFEEKKYKGMLKRMQDLGVSAGLYVCIFGTHIYIYNIQDIVDNTQITYKYLPANSFNDGTFETKAIYDFRKDLARTKVQLDNNNKWIKL